jgi:acetylornithine/succinyldiaminopimelate/putrescine aminotransferase
MPTPELLIETYQQILREKLPNLFRLYLNPYVTQVCFCLDRYVRTTWEYSGDGAEPFQSFIANGFDEALSGAIKLARYCASVAGRPTTGLVIGGERIGPFSGFRLPNSDIVEFIPGLVVAGHLEELQAALASGCFGFVVLAEPANNLLADLSVPLWRLVQRDGALVITCVDRATLADLRAQRRGLHHELAPDIVVFDETFVNRDVPFSAFTARRSLYDHWNQPGTTTFHSTTYQPNTISSLHFMRCLTREDAEFRADVDVELERICTDLTQRGELFRRLYSPSLHKAIRMTGCESTGVRAAGHYVEVNGRRVFDAVSGVACSIRGHNPPNYAEEIAGQGSLEKSQVELSARLRALTGLEHLLPAVSGATAVETALKIALVAQFPRRQVLALKAGFGGKTLLALAGTWNSSYKEHIDPLYAHVSYVDPFATDAIAHIDSVLEKNAVAVVQVELIQGVGGVRRVPEKVIRHLAERRAQAGYLLLVDEIQTGMYRTGSFTQSEALGLMPDLLVIGKSVSDMMFPYAFVLYSSALQFQLERVGCGLIRALRNRCAYEFGYRTALNVLRQAEQMGLRERVSASGELFARLLNKALAECPAVREVRVYGLLIGIELDTAGLPRRWFRKRLFWFYLFNMLRHPRFPVFVGFCQYEPNVLKITPPLTTEPEEIRQICATLADVLKRPFYRLAATVLGRMMRSVLPWRRKNEHCDIPAPEPVAS